MGHDIPGLPNVPHYILIMATLVLSTLLLSSCGHTPRQCCHIQLLQFIDTNIRASSVLLQTVLGEILAAAELLLFCLFLVSCILRFDNSLFARSVCCGYYCC